MPTVPTSITALTGITPPSTSDPQNFDPRADQFLGAFPTLQAQINAISTDNYNNSMETYTYAASASTSAANAASSSSIASAAATAAQIANTAAVKWAVGTAFSEGQLSWSPTNFQTYRRKTAGSGGSDPGNGDNGTNWFPVGNIMQPIIVSGGSVAVVPFGYYILTDTTTLTAIPSPAPGVKFTIENISGKYDHVILRNGSLFYGQASDVDHDIEGVADILYTGATYGWRYN